MIRARHPDGPDRLNTVPTFAHRGTLHVHYGEKTLSVRDGLPKFKDMPANFGGSGVELPE